MRAKTFTWYSHCCGETLVYNLLAQLTHAKILINKFSCKFLAAKFNTRILTEAFTHNRIE